MDKLTIISLLNLAVLCFIAWRLQNPKNPRVSVKEIKSAIDMGNRSKNKIRP